MSKMRARQQFTPISLETLDKLPEIDCRVKGINNEHNNKLNEYFHVNATIHQYTNRSIDQ